MNKRLVWIIIALLAIIVTLVALKKAGVIGIADGVKVTAEAAAERTIVETVNASGKIFPEIEVKVSSDISGEIVELNVQEGDSVKQGQVLAKIFADIYDTQREQAEAVVNQQLANVANSKAQLEGLKATLDQAKITYERQKTLLNEKVISKSEFEQAENALRTAQANYDAAVQNIISIEASVASAKAALERANKDLGRTSLSSPMNGIVTLLAVKKGERVVGTAQMAGTEMMRIADMSRIEVRVDVSENDIPKVNLGDTAIIEMDAYSGKKFTGVVTQIASSTTNATTSALTSEVTNYKVHIRLSPESYKDLSDPEKPNRSPFRPGMSASADIQTKRKENVLSVPINAVTIRRKESENGKQNTPSGPTNSGAANDSGSLTYGDEPDVVVFVLLPNGTVEKRIVKTGIQDLNYIQITDGLKLGEVVVTAPYSTVSKTLKAGMKVRVVTKEELFENE